MKSKVRLSSFSFILTLIIVLILIGVIVFTYKNEIQAFYVLLTVTFLLLLAALIYGPLAIYADEEKVEVRSILRRRKIKIVDIESVELFQPTMGAIRVCGSGGFFGYWGIFKEGDIGRYQAYYGKASECFLIKLRNGDKYVLGCENPEGMVERIKSVL